MSELHLLPCFSASVESTKKTRRPWLWAMGTCKRPSVAMHRIRIHFYCCICNSGASRADFTIVARSFWVHKLCEKERLEEERKFKKSRDYAEGQL
ncbi:hypothetical protein LEMLEM_LOCUS9852 [Lemmus lemmus]